jgi:hypothetical protein
MDSCSMGWAAVFSFSLFDTMNDDDVQIAC